MHRREQLFGRSRRLYIGFVASIVLRPGRQRSSATPIIAKGLVYLLQNYRASKLYTHVFASFSYTHHKDPRILSEGSFLCLLQVLHIASSGLLQKNRGHSLKYCLPLTIRRFRVPAHGFGRADLLRSVFPFPLACVCCGFDSPSTCGTRSRAVPLLSCSDLVR